MKFLLTNDDGWEAPGLQTLAKVARHFGDVWIVGPAGPMSGISHQVTWERPLTLEEKGKQEYSLDGTPADCVRIGLTQLGVKFDWVFSGINNGANLGTDIYVSGTVAAVREAALQGTSAVAFSQHRWRFQEPDFDWTVSELFAQRALEGFTGRYQQFAPQTAINVNFPDVEPSESAKVEWVQCELDRKPLPLAFEKDERGRFVSCSVYNDRLRTPGRDVETCFDGAITETRIDLDVFK